MIWRACRTVFFASCVGLILFFVSPARAQDFVIEDIRLEGLQRVSAGVIFGTLPFEPGAEVTVKIIQNVIRDLFATGNFDDVTISREGNVLVIAVAERPFISNIALEGNKAIKSEDLLDGLSKSGLAAGQVLKRATLEGLRSELRRQYSSRGRYDSKVEAVVTSQPRNRVDILLKIDEGTPARIRQINLIGNTVFTAEQLFKNFESRSAGRFAFLSKRSQYVKETFSNDLEKLASYYLDRGYIRFEVESVQVSVSPDRNSVIIDISVHEGEQYKVRELKFLGELLVSEKIFKEFIPLKVDKRYSEVLLKNSEEQITSLINNVGYLDAEVRSVPEIDDQRREVDIRFYIVPGARTYVRRINFSGNQGTSDEVLRREMRQLESAPASRAAIEQSRVRLERLGFFRAVEIDTEPVPGLADEVDLLVDVEEEFTGSLVFSLGYNDTYGSIFRVGLSRRNFFGTGNSIQLQVQSNRAQEQINISLINPYFTASGVSRSFNLYYSDLDLDEVNITRYSARRVGTSLAFSYPLSEVTRISLGLGYDKTEIFLGNAPVQEIRRSPLLFSESLVSRQVASGDSLLPLQDEYVLNPEFGFVDTNGTEYESYLLQLGWSTFRLNRGQLATRGSSHRVNLQLALPGSEIEYFKLVYLFETFWPLGDTFTLRTRARLGYGDSYSGSGSLPFFEFFTAGGQGTLRGFEGNTLGPRSTPALAYTTQRSDPDDATSPLVYVLGEDNRLQTRQVFTSDEPEPFGGNLITVLNFELLFPLPFVDNQRSVRSGFFLDIGNVFNTECLSSQQFCSDFDVDELRASIGFSVVWITALGPLNFTLAYPLKEGDDDDTERFDFSVGRGLGL